MLNNFHLPDNTTVFSKGVYADWFKLPMLHYSVHPLEQRNYNFLVDKNRLCLLSTEFKIRIISNYKNYNIRGSVIISWERKCCNLFVLLSRVFFHLLFFKFFLHCFAHVSVVIQGFSNGLHKMFLVRKANKEHAMNTCVKESAPMNGSFTVGGRNCVFEKEIRAILSTNQLFLETGWLPHRL